jgi:DNA polymerase-3 subunit alpha
MGIAVLPPDINESFAKFTLVKGTEGTGDAEAETGKIRFGLETVKNVGVNIVQAIIEARKSGRPFLSLEDFAGRIHHKDFNKKSLEALIKCGALDALGERNQLLANIETILEYNREAQRTLGNGQENLFSGVADVRVSALRLRPAPPAEKRERLAWEKELLGLYVTEHPMRDYAEKFSQKRLTPLKDLSRGLHNQLVSIGGLVNAVQKVTTKSGDPMLFVKIEDLTARTEILVFPKVLAQTAGLWREDKVLLIRGRLSDKDGVPKVLCEEAGEII